MNTFVLCTGITLVAWSVPSCAQCQPFLVNPHEIQERKTNKQKVCPKVYHLGCPFLILGRTSACKSNTTCCIFGTFNGISFLFFSRKLFHMAIFGVRNTQRENSNFRQNKKKYIKIQPKGVFYHSKPGLSQVLLNILGARSKMTPEVRANCTWLDVPVQSKTYQNFAFPLPLVGCICAIRIWSLLCMHVNSAVCSFSILLKRIVRKFQTASCSVFNFSWVENALLKHWS